MLASVHSRSAVSRSSRLALRIERQPAERLAGDEPGQRDPRVVGGDARRVGAGADRHAGLQHAPDRRRALGRLGAVALDEVLALVGHAVLDGDAAAERRDAVDVAVGDGLGMVEEPVQARRSGTSRLTFSNTSSARVMVSS